VGLAAAGADAGGEDDLAADTILEGGDLQHQGVEPGSASLGKQLGAVLRRKGVLGEQGVDAVFQCAPQVPGGSPRRREACSQVHRVVLSQRAGEMNENSMPIDDEIKRHICLVDAAADSPLRGRASRQLSSVLLSLIAQTFPARRR